MAALTDAEKDNVSAGRWAAKLSVAQLVFIFCVERTVSLKIGKRIKIFKTWSALRPVLQSTYFKTLHSVVHAKGKTTTELQTSSTKRAITPLAILQDAPDLSNPSVTINDVAAKYLPSKPPYHDKAPEWPSRDNHDIMNQLELEVNCMCTCKSLCFASTYLLVLPSSSQNCNMWAACVPACVRCNNSTSRKNLTHT